MKLAPALAALLATFTSQALDISLTPWKQAPLEFFRVFHSVDGTIFGRVRPSPFAFSMDAGTSASTAQQLQENTDAYAYRGEGVIQVFTNLYKLVDGRAVKVAHAAPGALGRSTALHGDRWITVAENIVYISPDAGKNWTQYLNPWGPVGATRVSITEVYHDGESFVGTGTGTWRSMDGTLWSEVTNKVVKPIFSGELCWTVLNSPGSDTSKWYTDVFVLRGDRLELLTKAGYGWSQFCVIPGGVFAWEGSVLRFHASDGTTVETAMPGVVSGVHRFPDQSIRVYAFGGGGTLYAWDSAPLTEPPFQQPVIASIAMVARLMVTGTPNSTVSVEGSPTANGPWQPLGRVLLGGNGQALWTDSVAADRAGWFYRMSATR